MSLVLVSLRGIIIPLTQNRGKNALTRYRRACEKVDVGSLGTVIEYFVGLSEKRLEEAQQSAEEKYEELEDLEAEEAPESLLLLASGLSVFFCDLAELKYAQFLAKERRTELKSKSCYHGLDSCGKRTSLSWKCLVVYQSSTTFINGLQSRLSTSV